MRCEGVVAPTTGVPLVPSVHPLVQILNKLRRQKIMIAMGVTAQLGKLTSTYSLST